MNKINLKQYIYVYLFVFFGKVQSDHFFLVRYEGRIFAYRLLRTDRVITKLNENNKKLTRISACGTLR